MATIRSLARQVAAAPQITVEDLPALEEAGFTLVINNRPDGEELGQPSGASIESAARGVGLDYVAAPIATLPPPPETVEAVQKALESLGPDDKALMFCKSGTRSTWAWALAERRRGGDADAIRDAAARAGYDLSRLPL